MAEIKVIQQGDFIFPATFTNIAAAHLAGAPYIEVGNYPTDDNETEYHIMFRHRSIPTPIRLAHKNTFPTHSKAVKHAKRCIKATLRFLDGDEDGAARQMNLSLVNWFKLSLILK